MKIWKLKFSINKEINIKKGLNEKIYSLNSSLDDFRINKVFITSFLKGLWDCPEALHHILNKTDNNIIKANLAFFIVNNFYSNYLSGNYMENNLLYLISLMLKDEIDKLENINQIDSFLENSKCGILLEELQKMPDIQIYFKNVILKTVEIIERTFSFREIKFSIPEKTYELKKLKEDEEKKIGKKLEKNVDEFYSKIINTKLIDQSIYPSRDETSIKRRENNDIFAKKYVPNLEIQTLEELAKNAANENKNNLSEYYNQFVKDIKENKNEEIYSNSNLMNNIFETNFPSHILAFYQNDFLEMLSFVEQLIKDLTNNILLLPNSIKYICKIISILVKRKFKNISKIDENAFISKFLLGKLLIPIITHPSTSALIDDFVISGITLKNIKLVNFIVKKLFSGKLFLNNKMECHFTPFNWFFLYKMEDILLFFEKVTKIKLPTFIDKFANGELPKNYSYDYFSENEEQIYASISICFNINNIFCLLKGLESGDFFNSNNQKIKKLQRSFKKLNTKENLKDIKDLDLKSLNRTKEKLKKQEKEIKNNVEIENIYFLIDKSIDKKYENLFKINNKIANFYIEEKKKKIEEKEKNLIKVKNYLCSSLGNYRLLNKADFNIEEKDSNTINILNEIKSYMSLPNFILNNNTIPSIWYINSILEYLTKIPEDYKENDYKKLFEELTQNLNSSINSLDFEILILFRNKLKFVEKMNNYFENIKNLVNNISINQKIKNIVEEISIPVDVVFRYDSKDKKFELTKSSIKEKLFEDKIVYEEHKKKFITFKTIEAFTNYFPNLSRYQLLQGINPFVIIKELGINHKLNNYFEIIKEKLIKNGIIDLKKYEDLYKEKIKDYIMNKIYEKIYPPEADELDSKIFKKAICLSWIEPNLILEGKDYIFDNLLPDILNEFEKINIVKTPYKKVNCIKNILAYITNLIKFNEGEDKNPGGDDITPVLNYVFIKAHPYRIFSDLEFIKIFVNELGKYEFEIMSIESMFSLVNNSTNETFKLSPEEYSKKCIDAVNNSNMNARYYNI